MSKLIFTALVVTQCLLFTGTHAQENTKLERLIPRFRDMIGKPLLDMVVEFNNDEVFTLSKITPQGASFFSGPNTKAAGDTFDTVRKRTEFSVSFATCSGSKALDAKISSIIAWESMDTANERALLPLNLQKLLGMMATPASITSPSALRGPKSDQLKGLVFEYIKGDTVENFSTLNDMDSPTVVSQLKFSWQITNNSYCPKS